MVRAFKMYHHLPLRSFQAAAVLSFLLGASALQAAEPLFDPVAARMMAASAELSGERSTPPPLVRKVKDLPVVTSLARPGVTLPPEEQSHFGPLSGGHRYDSRMIEAARIARHRAQPHGTFYCWRYVKDALVQSGVVGSRPTTAYAKQAGAELCQKYGFVKLRVSDPMDAPVGAVLVYGGSDAGHVELRTESGFVSDFVSRTPYHRRLLGAFVKPS
jgi:hypothetical protein